jgi:hypothetical protein
VKPGVERLQDVVVPVLRKDAAHDLPSGGIRAAATLDQVGEVRVPVAVVVVHVDDRHARAGGAPLERLDPPRRGPRMA